MFVSAIMLARFKMPYSELRKAMEDLDESILTVDNLTALKQYIPQPDEISALNETEGNNDKLIMVITGLHVSSTDQNNLSAPDKYFLEVSKISNLGPRLECMFTKGTFVKKAEAVNAVCRLSSLHNVSCNLNLTYEYEQTERISDFTSCK